MLPAFLFASLCLGQADPVFDVPALLAPPLSARVLKSAEKGGIVTEEVMFHSEKDGDKSVDLFAYFSYPKGGKRLPAFVWNQGGLGQATTYWTEFGAKRGYATLCIDFPLPGYRSTGGYPINSGVELTDDPKKAPIYHGAVALLRAVSFLQSRPEVDPERIGMAGSSWGGFYTTLMVGIDSRLKVGSSMFGSGGLQLGNSWWDGQGPNPKRDDAFRRRWAASLDPALRLGKTPLAWFTGSNDSFYWLPAVMQSHAKTSGRKHLAILPNWNHALTPTLDEQVFVWLDIHLKGAAPFLQVTPLERDDCRLRWKVSGERKAAKAEVAVGYGDAGNWHHRPWIVLPAQLDGTTCTAELPRSPWPGVVYATVIDSDGFLSSTAMLNVPATDATAPPVKFNGCDPWGDFEEGGIEILRLHGLPTPMVGKTAKTGKQAANLKGPRTTLGPIHFVAGQPHTLTAFFKAETPMALTLHLEGSFDGKKDSVMKKVDVTTDWTPVVLDFTPPRAVSGSLRAVVELPKGTNVLVDDVRFGPQDNSRKH